jgi:hypothetical protein
MASPMYVTPDRTPAEPTVDQIVARLRSLALDAGDEAHKAVGGQFAVKRREDSRMLMAAAKLLTYVSAEAIAEARGEGA